MCSTIRPKTQRNGLSAPSTVKQVHKIGTKFHLHCGCSWTRGVDSCMRKKIRGSSWSTTFLPFSTFIFLPLPSAIATVCFCHIILLAPFKTSFVPTPSPRDHSTHALCNEGIDSIHHIRVKSANHYMAWLYNKRFIAQLPFLYWAAPCIQHCFPMKKGMGHFGFCRSCVTLHAKKYFFS